MGEFLNSIKYQLDKNSERIIDVAAHLFFIIPLMYMLVNLIVYIVAFLFMMVKITKRERMWNEIINVTRTMKSVFFQ